jgi:hypothetical protein
MTNYQYEISISAASEAEADTKAQALAILAQKLKARELAKLAEVVKNDPVKTAFAKKALGV